MKGLFITPIVKFSVSILHFFFSEVAFMYNVQCFRDCQNQVNMRHVIGC